MKQPKQPRVRYQINVSAAAIQRNRQTGGADPTIIVRDYQAPAGQEYTMARAVAILGPSTVASNGVSTWVETNADLGLVDARPGLDQ